MTALQGGAVLAPFDLSSQSLNAAWRGALVARDLAAPLRLLHVQEGGDAAAARDAVQQLARDIGRHFGRVVEVELRTGDPLSEAVHAARDAAVVVIGSPRGNPLRELVLGTQAERLIRLCRVPVLLVKRPAAGAYRKVLAAAELGPSARAVAAAAARLSRDPRVEVLHALDVRDEIGMRACDVPEAVVRTLRQRAAERARRALHDLLAVDFPGAWPAVGFGDAAAAVLAREQALRADLLVVGKRQRALLADFFLGSVTQRVLASARADVLVLPVPAAHGGRPAARMGSAPEPSVS